MPLGEKWTAVVDTCQPNGVLLELIAKGITIGGAKLLPKVIADLGLHTQKFSASVAFKVENDKPAEFYKNWRFSLKWNAEVRNLRL